MAKKKKTLFIDEEISRKCEEMVKAKVEIQSYSHLVETLILKEYSKFKKGSL